MLCDLECCGCHARRVDMLVGRHVPIGRAVQLDDPCPECGGTEYVRPGVERTANMSAQWGESCRGDGHKYLGGGKSKAAKQAREAHRAREAAAGRA